MGWGIRAAAAALLLSCIHASSAGAQTRPPVEAFGQLPEFDDPVISPDGKYVAAIQGIDGKPVAVIYTVGAPSDAKPPALFAVKDWIVSSLQWVKNDRLAVFVRRGGNFMGGLKVETWTRQLTISPEGRDPVVLMHNQATLGDNIDVGGIVDVDEDDPNRVFMSLFVPTVGGYDFRLDILSVDARTGDSTSFLAGRQNTTAWYMDGHGHVLARIDQTKQPLTDHVKFYDGNDWHDAGDFDAEGDKGAGLEGLTEDGKAVAFNERDKDGMSILAGQGPDAKKETVLFSNPDYDLDSVLMDDWTGRVVGASYADDRMQYVYFDPVREALQHGLERAFPGMTVHAVSTDMAKDRLIVAVEGPQSPLTYYFLDRASHQAVPILSAYPHIQSSDLGQMKPYPYTARDGLSIHAYLTLPPGSTAESLPLVVLPHGGPVVRDMLQFDWMAQFFANRGYAVFQPNFRGSSGYGHHFIDAGYKQSGLKMQDDITDGVRRLIADGVADPKRICIVGGSYGGYAALAGATFTPDLYACAVSYAGVSDFPTMLRNERGEFGKDSDVVSIWQERLGTLADDYDRLEATSPARHADQVRCPVLLMHGENDTTVRIEQSEKEADALKEAHKSVRFIRFPGEDHYFSMADTRIRFLTETERFLAANIGAGSAAAGLSAALK